MVNWQDVGQLQGFVAGFGFCIACLIVTHEAARRPFIAVLGGFMLAGLGIWIVG